MERKNLFLLLHPFFLFNLFLLIANDHWWKYAYANELTGKISDFAGVLVLAIFMIAVLRFNKLIALISTALLFVWWKSPLSQPFITAFGLSRVVDYSDLLALTMLPLVFLIRPFVFRFPVKAFTIVIAGITLTAMFATSMPMREFWQYPPGRVSVDKSWNTKLKEQEFLHKLDSLHIPYKKEYVEYLPVNSQGFMLVEKNASDSIYRMKRMDDFRDTSLMYEKHLGEHYMIPYLALEKDTITNIRFRFYEEKRKSYIDIMSIVIPKGMEYNYYMKRPIRKKYRALLKSFMLE